MEDPKKDMAPTAPPQSLKKPDHLDSGKRLSLFIEN